MQRPMTNAQRRAYAARNARIVTTGHAVLGHVGSTTRGVMLNGNARGNARNGQVVDNGDFTWVATKPAELTVPEPIRA
jgi:hypothetical protein